MKFYSIVACGLGLSLYGAGAMGANPVVYPTPQKAQYSGDRIETPQKIIRVDRSSKVKGQEKWLKDVPEVSGAYRLKVTPEVIIIAGHDKRGIFYGEQTLIQLRDGKKTIPVAEIVDWPDIPFRGTVEGFYGIPWSHQARINQLKFYGQTKMNTYIYGPKDDPFHSAKWRVPYPEKEANQIRELVKIAKENHVDFVWAIHPGHNIKWNDEDMHNVIKKFELMYDLGVRSFSVFFDDIGGEGTRADMQAKLLNMINDEFVKVKGDVTPLVMCPTQYNRSWTSGDYLDVLGNNLAPETHVMWTGNTVCHDITKEGQDWVNARIKRPSYVWWNFPVTDYCKASLCMGRTYGLTQDEGAEKTMSGFVSNPMDKPEASKLSLFGVADYTWNIHQYQSEKAWKDGIKRLFPDAAEAIQTFANHNSDQGPNGHGYRREESVEIAPLAQEFRKKLAEGVVDTQLLAQLKKEYMKIKEAPATIRAKANNALFLVEVKSWLEAFEQLGNAGIQSLTAAQKAAKNQSDLASIVSATKSLHKIYLIGQENLLKPIPHTVNVGALVMKPTMEEALQFASAKNYAQLANKPMMKPLIITNLGNESNREKIIDGDFGSFWHSGQAGKEGDWVGVDYGALVPVRSINIAMGRKADDKSDFISKGQIEVSQDMKTWKALGPETEGLDVEWRGNKAMQVRGVRYRTLEHSQIDGKPSWLAVREIALNKPSGAKALSNAASLKSMGTYRTDKFVGINRIMEVHKLAPGEFIELVLPQSVDATWLELCMENDQLKNWGDVSVGRGDNKYTKMDLKQSGNVFTVEDPNKLKAVKSLKLTNKSNEPQEVALKMFKFDVPKEDATQNAASLSDSNLISYYSADKPLNVVVPNYDIANPASVSIVGSAACAVMAESQGKWINVGTKPQGGKSVASFKLPAKTTAVKLLSDKPQPGEIINEVVFKAAK